MSEPRRATKLIQSRNVQDRYEPIGRVDLGHPQSWDASRSNDAKKNLAIESPATTIHRFARALWISVGPWRSAPHRRASLDHCQLSVWLGPQVATLVVVESQLQQHHVHKLNSCHEMHFKGQPNRRCWLYLTLGIPTQPPELNRVSQNSSYSNRNPVLALQKDNSRLLTEPVQ